MRDVTDNRTAELLAGVRPGRGRPRKPNALSNAERQAAYRARHKAAVTVTENAGAFRGEQLHQDVGGLEDAMAELRAELDATKAELAEAHETIDEMTDELAPLRAIKARCEEEDDTLARMRRQRNEAVAELAGLKVELAAVRLHLDLTEKERNEAFSTVARLKTDLDVAEKRAGKAVTSNEKSATKAPAKKSVTRKAVTKKAE